MWTWAWLACTGSAPPARDDTAITLVATGATGSDTAAPPLPAGEPRFLPAPDAGLTLRHWDGLTRPCIHEALFGGAAVGDVDGDGDLDLFQPRLHLEDALWLNDGAGRFTLAPTFVGDRGASSGALFLDVDGDRDLDLYVARLGPSPNLLYINDGAGGFVDEAVARGADLTPAGCAVQASVSAADVDGDGDLDLAIAGWTDRTELGLRDRSYLLLDEGGGRYVDATAEWGLDALRDRAAFGMLLADQDADGDPDLHLVADWGGSGFWRNEGGGFVEEPGPFTDENGMGADLGDVDGDGDLDWFVSSIWDDDPGPCPDGWGCSGNRLYVVQGATFTDGTDAAGVREGQWGWGAAFFDQDLDGDGDLAMTGGFQVIGFQQELGRLWRNDRLGRFEDVTEAAGFTFRGQGRTLLPADVDRDGDLDLIVVDSARPPELWRAEGAEGRGWLELDLDQPGLNRFAVGATVTVRATASSAPQVRLLHANALYAGGPPPEVHFGLGDHDDPIAEVRVRWPDGGESVFTDVGQGRVTLAR